MLIFFQQICHDLLYSDQQKSHFLIFATYGLFCKDATHMVFHTSKRNVIYPNLKVNNNNIERVTEFNFLGVILHSHVTWNKHINHMSIKIARSIGILYRLKNVYLESILVTIYNTLVLPHFHYCLLLWGSVVKENHPLHLLQKKALRIITNSDYLAHTEPICKKLRILRISDMFSVALWKFYSIIN